MAQLFMQCLAGLITKVGNSPRLANTNFQDCEHSTRTPDLFIIDEVNAISAATVAQLHDTMMAIFNENRKKTGMDTSYRLEAKKSSSRAIPAKASSR